MHLCGKASVVRVVRFLFGDLPETGYNGALSPDPEVGPAAAAM